MKLQIGEKEIDLNGAFPLTVGDVKELEKIGIMDSKGEMSTGSFARVSDLVLYLARKVDQEVTESEIDNIPIHKLGKLGDFLAAKMEEVGINRPT